MNELAHVATMDDRPVTPVNDTAGFVGIFVVSFVVFLLIALCAQMVALPWRSWLPGAEGQKSLVGGVRTSVYTFMSYLN